MALTVNDVLTLEVLNEAQVLVGAEGLNNKVSFVDVIEVPDIAEWSKPETIYLTTAYPFSQDPIGFEKIIQNFIENGVSAIFIKLGRFIENIPPGVFKIANEHKFPIVILPTEVVYSPIITGIAQKIYEDQAKSGIGSFSFQQKLNNLLVHSEGLDLLAETLVQEVGGEIFIENKAGQLVYSAGQQKFIKTYSERQWLSWEENSHDDLNYYHSYNRTVVVMPTYLGHELQGSIIAIIDGVVVLDQTLYEPLKRSAIIIALALSREESIYEKRIRLEQDVLEEIIDNEHSKSADLSLKMNKIDWDFDHDQLFAIFNFERKDSYISDRPKIEQTIQKIAYRLTHWLRKENMKAIVMKKNDNLVCFFNLAHTTTEPVKSLEEKLTGFQKEMEREFMDFIISIGLSKKTVGVEKLNKSYRDAQKAVRIGKRAYGRGLIYDFEKMGVYKLLFTHENVDSLQEFYQDYLEPLVQYDQKHGSDLVNTLESYCMNDSNALLTAEQMYIHRNTLNYRLKRASEILGFQLDNMDNKQCLVLALKIKKLLNF